MDNVFILAQKKDIEDIAFVTKINCIFVLAKKLTPAFAYESPCTE